MGQSFGGAVASHYAYNYPQFTKALILIDSVIGAGNIALYIRFLFRRGPKLTKLYMHLPKFIQKRIAFFYMVCLLRTLQIKQCLIDKKCLEIIPQ